MRRHLGAVIALALVIMAVFTWKGSGNSNPDPTASSQPSASASTQPATASNTKKELRRLNERVKAFSELYFSLSPAKSPEQIESEVAPYATKHFLQTATFGFGTSKADDAMIAKGGSIETQAVSDLNGMFLSEHTITGSVTLLKTELDRDGNVVKTSEVQQEMTWEQSNGVWLVYEAPRT